MAKKIKIFFSICVLSVVFLCGCESQPSPIEQKEYQLRQGYVLMDRYSLQTMVVDSCEYLYAYTGKSNFILTHKGNCKYCRAWAEKHY